jgi:hypothetical protein
MATPPPRSILSADDIPGAPGWLEKVVGHVNGFTRPTAEALAKGLTFRENFAGEVKDVTFTAPDDWTLLESSRLLNSWQFYPSTAAPDADVRLRYRKTIDGMVEVVGLAMPPTSTTIGNVFSWPPGCEPRQLDIFGLQSEGTWVEVRTTSVAANVAVRGPGGGSQGWVSFSGLRFAAADPTPPRWASPLEVALGQPGKPFPGRPGCVLVLGCRKTERPGDAAFVTALDWVAATLDKRATGTGIRIHRAWGLVPGVRYTLTLLILPE